MSSFVITEQVSIVGHGDLVVLVNRGLVFTDFSNTKPKVLFTPKEIRQLGIDMVEGSVSLGELESEQIALIELDPCQSSRSFDDGLVNLRQVIPSLSAHETQIVSRASQLSTWLSKHRYCGCCGAETRLAENDRALVCTQCDNRIYPQLAPCVIGVIVKGDNILLANGVRFNNDIYSALAGFIEAGESAEQAFAREVHEEAGIHIRDIEYIGSQSWPFPNQLMFGFIAHHASGNLKIDRKEINHADWFDISELPRIPEPYTIARHVINEAISRISAAHV